MDEELLDLAHQGITAPPGVYFETRMFYMRGGFRRGGEGGPILKCRNETDVPTTPITTLQI
jgi:hypothetical protein